MLQHLLNEAIIFSPSSFSAMKSFMKMSYYEKFLQRSEKMLNRKWMQREKCEEENFMKNYFYYPWVWKKERKERKVWKVIIHNSSLLNHNIHPTTSLLFLLPGFYERWIILSFKTCQNQVPCELMKKFFQPLVSCGCLFIHDEVESH